MERKAIKILLALFLMAQLLVVPAMPVTVSAAEVGNAIVNRQLQPIQPTTTANELVRIAEREFTNHGNRDLPRPNKYQSQPEWWSFNDHWCVMFMSYVAREANIPTSVIPRAAAVLDVLNFARNNNRLIDRNQAPRVGDIAIQREGMSHLNIVVAVNGSNVTTVGGNEGGGNGRVMRQTWNWQSGTHSFRTGLTGWFRPFGTVQPQPPVSGEFFPRYTGNSTSIIDALNALGIDSSFNHRAQIAAANNIANYTGTAAQNTTMLNLLRAGTLRRPGGAVNNYFPRYTGNSTSIIDALNALGIDSSFNHRAQIAAANGIANFTGTAAQNTTMLNLLRAGTLRRP